MTFLSNEDKEVLRAAVHEAERRTSGEILTVIAASSDEYHYIPLLWAAIAALLTPLPLIYFTDLFVEHIYLTQLGVFISLALILRLKALRFAAVPGVVKRKRAHRQAMEQFLAQNLHMTTGRTGVLIFVSVAERYAEIIADQGIYEKVDKAIWSDALELLLSSVRRGEIAEGFVGAINACGEVLAEHFPPGSRDENELPDHIIEI